MSTSRQQSTTCFISLVKGIKCSMHRKQYHAIHENMFIELMFGKSISIIISMTDLEGNNVWITYLDEN